MKGVRFILSLIMLVGLAYSNVGYALSDVTTEKAKVKITQADTQVSFYGVYELVNDNAPEVFTDLQEHTKVFIYGAEKVQAYQYLTKEKKGIGIYIGNKKECYKDYILAVKICKPDKSKVKNKLPDKNYKIPTDRKYTGAVIRISKKWVLSRLI